MRSCIDKLKVGDVIEYHTRTGRIFRYPFVAFGRGEELIVREDYAGWPADAAISISQAARLRIFKAKCTPASKISDQAIFCL